MKKTAFLFSVLLLIQYALHAQQAISYQGVAKNAAGQMIPNQSIFIKFNLHQGSTSGMSVFYGGMYETGGDIQIAVFKPGAGATSFGSSNSIDAHDH